MENEVPDMSNAHMDGDRPACEGEGEDPEILADIAKATQDLAVLLKLHNIEVDYCEADWKDNKGLIEDAHTLMLKHPDWHLCYFSGDTWGIDSNFVFFTSREVEDEVVEEIGEYIIEFGAELPEEVVPPKPVCPKCGMEIELLCGGYSAVVPAKACISEGELYIDIIDGIKVYDVIEGEVETWHCPECDAELFKAGEEAEMTAFLKCESKEE